MKRVSGFVCFLLGAGLATLLTILFGRGRSSDFAPVVHRSPAEQVLQRTLEDVRIDPMSFDQAVALLAKQSGVQIFLDRPTLEMRNTPRWIEMERTFDASASVSLKADRIALADALMELIRQAGGHSNVECAPVKDRIVITKRFSANDPPFLATYDIRDLLGRERDSRRKPLARVDTRVPVWLFEFQGQEVIGSLPDMVAPDSWTHPGEARGEQMSGRLVVLQTWEVHREIQQLLARLREGPELPWAENQRPINLRVWSASLRRYMAVDDAFAEAALRRQFEHIDIEDRPLQEALDTLAAQAQVRLTVDWLSLRDTGFYPAQIVSIRGDRVTLAAALEQLFQSMPGQGTRKGFGFQPDGKAVYIGTAENTVSVRTYDLRDFEASLQAAHFPDNGTALADLITTSVAPASWGQDGRSLGWVLHSKSTLVVRQSWENLEKIERLLDDIVTDPLKPPATQPAGR
jgi:hypothetical protein